MTEVAVINHSTAVTDQQVATFVAAQQKQFDNDFYPLWGLPTKLYFVGQQDVSLPKLWQLVVLDDSDQADALGYHDVSINGLPLGKIFAKTTIDAGDHWTVTASHEALEMRVDPSINETVDSPDGTISYAKEVGDPCEDDSQGYLIDGVLLSDFVTPSWFGIKAFGETKFDFQGLIGNPFELLANGYIGVRTNTQGWTSKTADGKPNMKARGQRGSRRERRTIPISQRIASTR